MSRSVALTMGDEDDPERARTGGSARRADHDCLSEAEVERCRQQRGQLILLQPAEAEVVQLDRVAGGVVLAELELGAIAGRHLYDSGVAFLPFEIGLTL